MTQHQTKFKVKLYNFQCSGLVSPDGERLDPFLRINFAEFKVFKTDSERNTAAPEWGFKAAFQYRTRHAEKLQTKRLHVQCFSKRPGERTQDELVGEATMDVLSLACGPPDCRLTLFDQQNPKKSRGQLTFTCSMKQLSTDLCVTLDRLCLFMQGFPAPAKLTVYSSLAETEQYTLPHRENGEWDEELSMTWEGSGGSIAELLSPDIAEGIHCEVYDAQDALQGEVLIRFREHFTLAPMALAFKAPVTYESAGTVGELSGQLQYRNLPKYCQMPCGVLLDGGVVQDPMVLATGLPLPPSIAVQPPVWTRKEPVAPAEPSFDHYLSSRLFHEQQVLEQSGLHVQVQRNTSHDSLDAARGDRVRPEYSCGQAMGGGGVCGVHGQCAACKRAQRLNEALPYCRREAEAGATHASYDAYQPIKPGDEIVLPPNWTMRNTRSGRKYFVDMRTRRMTLVDPRFLPDNWDQRIDEKGIVYFAYHKTRQTSYTDPRGLSERWQPRVSHQAEDYYMYLPTKRTTFADPRGMPAGISACLDDKGRMYFKIHASRQTRWEDPRHRAGERAQRWREEEYASWWREQVQQAHEELEHRARETEARELLEDT